MESSMTSGQRAQERCRQNEGFESESYDCPTGHRTIGYGHKIQPGEAFTGAITQSEAAALFAEDWNRACMGARKLLEAHPCPKDFGDVRFHVIVEMVFQMGQRGVARFARMWAAIERGDYQEAAREMRDSKWETQTPARARSLAQIMVTGVDADGETA